MWQKLKQFYFTIDLRSLGLFRILLGLLLLYDWCVRWPNLEAFYTTFGVLPIDAPLPIAGGDFHFSLMDGLRSLPMVRLFFFLGLICYVAFLLGYRTRLFVVLSFLFFASVSNRNIIIRHGGDVVMLAMLAWSMFLPLGKRFSLDAVLEAMRRGVDLRQRRGIEAAVPGDTVGGVATEADAATAELSQPSLAAFVIVCQIGLIYFLTAYAKWGEEWMNGTALYYALQIDQVAKPFGKWFADQPLWMIKALTWSTLCIEYAASPFILLPFWQPLLRRIMIVTLTGLHLGIWLTMEIGTFPFVMIATYALLLLPRDWECIRRCALRWSRRAIVYYDDTCGFCYRCAQLLAIADRAGYIRFIGSSDRKAFEHELSKKDLDAGFVVVDQGTQHKTTQSDAAAAIAAALPLPFHIVRCFAWPGLRSLSNGLLNRVARHRYQFSAWLGFKAGGVARVTEDGPTAESMDDAPLARAWRCSLRTAANAFVALVFACVLVDSYNLNMTDRSGETRIEEPRWMQAIILAPQLVHDWHLFAPYPMTDDGWWVIDGVTESGDRYDPLTGKAPTFEKPADLTQQFDAAWRKYLYRIWLKDYTGYRLWFGQYITRKNHREKRAGHRLVRFKVYYVLETTLPPGSPRPFPTERIEIWSHECFDKPPAIPNRKP